MGIGWSSRTDRGTGGQDTNPARSPLPRRRRLMPATALAVVALLAAPSPARATS